MYQIKKITVEKAFVIVSLFWFCGPLIQVLFVGSPWHHPIFSKYIDFYRIIPSLIYSSLYFSVILYFFMNRARWLWFIRLIKKYWFLFTPYILSLFSVFWSIDPLLSFRRTIAILGTTLFGIYLGSRFNIDSQLILLRRVLIFIAVLSLLFVVFRPWNLGIAFTDGTWIGVYHQRNPLAKFMALGIIISVLTFVVDQKSKEYLFSYKSIIQSWIPLFLFVLLFFNNLSATPAIAMLGIFVLYPFYQALSVKSLLGGAFVIFFSVLILFVLATVLMNIEAFFFLFGKDMTLSLRVPFWIELFDYISMRPWFGYGYSSFWSDDLSFKSDIGKVVGIELGYAHNGWIEILLGLGIIGLLVVILILFVFTRQAYLFSRERITPNRMWPMLFLTYILISNTSANLLFDPNSVWWVLIVSTLVAMKQQRETNNVNYNSYNFTYLTR